MAAKVKKLDLVREQVITAYSNGSSLNELAKLYNVSKGTIRNLIVTQQTGLRKQGRPKSTVVNKPVFVEENV